MVVWENDTTSAYAQRRATARPKIAAASHRRKLPSRLNTEFIEPEVRGQYTSFGELVAACAEWCDHINARPHRETGVALEHVAGVAVRHPTIVAVGITTRNRDQASHAQNNCVLRPATRGPSPQSNCTHSPGSATHGGYVRRRPTR